MVGDVLRKQTRLERSRPSDHVLLSSTGGDNLIVSFLGPSAVKPLRK